MRSENIQKSIIFSVLVLILLAAIYLVYARHEASVAGITSTSTSPRSESTSPSPTTSSIPIPSKSGDTSHTNPKPAGSITYNFSAVVRSVGPDAAGQNLINVTESGTLNRTMTLHDGPVSELTMYEGSCDVKKSNFYAFSVSYDVSSKTYTCTSAKIGFLD